jgi:hypothetical protein
MKTDGSFSCSIKLRKEYDDVKGNRLDAVVEVPFGEPITNLQDIEQGIRRAQKALLNPKTDHATYLRYSTQRDHCV